MLFCDETGQKPPLSQNGLFEKYLFSEYLGRIPSTTSRNRTKTGKIGHEIGIGENGVFSETKN